jgi:hypothetical protein
MVSKLKEERGEVSAKLLKNKHIMFTLPGVVGAAVMLIQGLLWVEDRYQHVTESICTADKHTLKLEKSGNEIRLEFYNNEIQSLAVKETQTNLEKQRIGYLNQSTIVIEARQRVLDEKIGEKKC